MTEGGGPHTLGGVAAPGVRLGGDDYSAGQASGETGCNRYTGTVALSGNTWTFTPLVSERIPCTDTTRLLDERQFLSEMQGVKTYVVDADGRLLLVNGSGTTVIRLTRVP